MKVASRILGALVVIMIFVLMIYAFVMAGDARKFVSNEENSGDVAGAIEDSASIIGAFLGYIGFILMCIIGVSVLIYLFVFIISYTRLFFNKCSVMFISYSAIVFGLLSIFGIIMTAINARAFYGLLIVLLLTTGFMIAYSVVTKKYMKAVQEGLYIDDDDEEDDNVAVESINPNDIKL